MIFLLIVCLLIDFWCLEMPASSLGVPSKEQSEF